MRFTRFAVVALIALFALTTAGSAAAQGTTCSYPASAYDDDRTPPFPPGPTNDPISGEQWGLGQIKAPAGWQRATGAGVVIAIVDTGVDFSHPDLQAKLLPGADFVPGGDECEGAQDEEGHGTHVAGIAAAVTNNSMGVAGAAPDAQILPVRVLDSEGSGESDWIIEGIRYAADQGAEVINLSLGPQLVGVLPNSEFEAAVDYAYERGAVVVAAAGNDSQPVCSYPASARRAVCVASTDSRENPSYFSNFPNDPDGTVGVRAPGGVGSFFCEHDEDVWSTIWPGSSSDCEEDLPGYDTLAGTSMSTPYVAGLAAMLSQLGLSNGQILECLRLKSSNRGTYDPVYGWGIVDADAATAECAPQSTATFEPPPPSGSGGSGGPGGGPTAGQQGLAINVRAHRTTRRKLARRGLLRVTVSSSGEALVKLRARMPKRGTSKKGRKVGRKTVYLRSAGSRTIRIRLKPRAQRLLRRSNRTLQVRWTGMGQRGLATARR